MRRNTNERVSTPRTPQTPPLSYTIAELEQIGNRPQIRLPRNMRPIPGLTLPNIRVQSEEE